MAAAGARLRCERANSRHAGAKTPRGSTRGVLRAPPSSGPGSMGTGAARVSGRERRVPCAARGRGRSGRGRLFFLLLRAPVVEHWNVVKITFFYRNKSKENLSLTGPLSKRILLRTCLSKKPKRPCKTVSSNLYHDFLFFQKNGRALWSVQLDRGERPWYA